jgi:dTDP-4-dehydrorhamnose reductase
MRVLVFGGDGQVGWEIRRLDGHAGHRVIAVPRREADITQPAEVMAAVRDAGAEVVVNPAAYTAVDRAETESELAFSVNRDGARNIAVACAKQSLPMIQISTDFVFDGSKQCAYAEDDPVGPLSVYGTSKEAGERAVRDTLDRHVILRTSWVFGALGQNFVKTMLSLAEEREELAVVNDQIGCPTPAADLAAAILDLLSSMSEGRWGTYHYCGAGRTSWYGFAEEIFAQYRRITGAPAPRLRAITTAEFPTPATRPANSELDCSRFAAVFGFGPRPWRRGLAAVLDGLGDSPLSDHSVDQQAAVAGI